MTQDTVADPFAWAAEESKRLRSLAPEAGDKVAKWMLPHAAPGMDFFSRFAPESVFEGQSRELFSGYMGAGVALAKLADLLDEWVQYAQSGITNFSVSPASARVEAATDLMEQVEMLLRDPRVHPAAPVVLAGAALEELLRSLAIDAGLQSPPKPSLSTWADALRAAGVLTQSEVKDITAWAGHRNEAAHGQFVELSKQRAQLMVDGINLFMQRRVPTT
ncbi:hypothetical protein NOCA1190025 [metagenome]|uniref:DUF4145 domain-containing protein n=1 Tax=metagenome TaxID=256318 RepID=A0A2P2CCF8_9ZZZZ